MNRRPVLSFITPAVKPFRKQAGSRSGMRLALCLFAGILGGCSQTSNSTQASASLTNDSTENGVLQSSQSASPEACAADSQCSSQSGLQDEKEARVQKAREITDTFTPMEFEKAIELFENKEDGLLYFGFPGCPWCQEVVPLLDQAARDNGVEVYYIQTRDDQHNRLYTDSQKERIIPYISEYMRDNDEGVPTLYVPLVLAVEDGKVVSGHQGTVDDHDAKARQMSEEEKDQVLQDMEKLAQTISQNSAD